MTTQRKISAELLGNELVFTTSRSGGPGGQHVNKVNSKVTLYFDVANSSILTEAEKEILQRKLASRLTQGGVVMLTAQESRSQVQNKLTAVRKFEALMAQAFKKRKARKPTKPSKAAVQDRIRKKKVISEKKKWRRKPGAES